MFLFVDHLVDMVAQGHQALLSRKCGKSVKGSWASAYARYSLTDLGRKVLRRYHASLSCVPAGSSSSVSTELLDLTMPPPLFVLEYEEIKGPDVCCITGEAEDKVCAHAVPANLCEPRCATPLLRGYLAVCCLLQLLDATGLIAVPSNRSTNRAARPQTSPIAWWPRWVARASRSTSCDGRATARRTIRGRWRTRHREGSGPARAYRVGERCQLLGVGTD